MAMEKYEKLEKVGEGTYGKVYKARCKATGQLVALKKTRLEEDDEEGVPPTALREISLLQMLSQDVHVVRLMDVEHGESKKGKPILYLIFEFLDCDLKTYIDTFRKSRTKIPLKIIKSFMYQLCQGVNFCHSRGVMHRDLKPRNLLVDKEKGLVKVADLGLGRAFTVPLKQYTHEILTLWYRAPEVLLGATHYSTPVDMWSVGCIFAELYNTHALFQGDCEINQLFHIFRYLGTPNEEVWAGVTKFKDWHEYPQWKKPKDLSRLVPDMDQTALDLLAQMFVYDPAKRISARKALVHPYFDDFDKSSMPKLL